MENGTSATELFQSAENNALVRESMLWLTRQPQMFGGTALYKRIDDIGMIQPERVHVLVLGLVDDESVQRQLADSGTPPGVRLSYIRANTLNDLCILDLSREARKYDGVILWGSKSPLSYRESALLKLVPCLAWIEGKNLESLHEAPIWASEDTTWQTVSDQFKKQEILQAICDYSVAGKVQDWISHCVHVRESLRRQIDRFSGSGPAGPGKSVIGKNFEDRRLKHFDAKIIRLKTQSDALKSEFKEVIDELSRTFGGSVGFRRGDVKENPLGLRPEVLANQIGRQSLKNDEVVSVAQRRIGIFNVSFLAKFRDRHYRVALNDESQKYLESLVSKGLGRAAKKEAQYIDDSLKSLLESLRCSGAHYSYLQSLLTRKLVKPSESGELQARMIPDTVDFSQDFLYVEHGLLYKIRASRMAASGLLPMILMLAALSVIFGFFLKSFLPEGQDLKTLIMGGSIVFIGVLSFLFLLVDLYMAQDEIAEQKEQLLRRLQGMVMEKLNVVLSNANQARAEYWKEYFGAVQSQLKVMIEQEHANLVMEIESEKGRYATGHGMVQSLPEPARDVIKKISHEDLAAGLRKSAREVLCPPSLPSKPETPEPRKIYPWQTPGTAGK